MTTVFNQTSQHVLTHEQRRLVERFEAAYNLIDRHMRKALRCDRMVGFSRVVKDFGAAGRLQQCDVDTLQELAHLRNVLVHGKVKPDRYLAVPMQFVVQQIESLGQQISRPDRVGGKTFCCRVETVGLNDSLASVLRLIATRDYSQFPVYSGQAFKGLLTENGITRWLAHHVTIELSLVELEDATVLNLVGEEEKRQNCQFFRRDRTFEEAKTAFSENATLEAIFVTKSGKPADPLLGIITRWDIIHHK